MPIAATAAQSSGPVLWFAGSRLILADAQPAVGDLAVPSNDVGLQTFLDRLGARIAYQPGQQFVVITTADRREIAFTIGENEFTVEGVRQSGPFAVSVRNNAAIIPFYTLARALDVAAVSDGPDMVLEPQITALDAHEDHGRTVIMIHGGMPLHAQSTAAGPGTVRFQFHGVGTILEHDRTVLTPGVRTIGLTVSGTSKNPSTTITMTTVGAVHSTLLPSFDPHGAVIAVAPENVALGGTGGTVPVVASLPEADPGPVTRAVTPAPSQPTPSIQNASNVVVSQVTTQSLNSAFIVRVAVSGTPKYRWRMLGDGRFFVDVPEARMDAPERADRVRDARVSALRVKANGTPLAPNVRIALTLNGQQNVHIASDAGSLSIRVDGSPEAVASRGGSGQVGGGQIPGSLNTGESVPDPGLPLIAGSALTPAPVPANGRARVIVLDPGHGGSDSGALGNGLTEKLITLDIARRLRTILVARGWQVVMTRDSDVDVYAANDSAREELQARCDVANRLNARMFVSIHVNSFTSPDLRGTTTYFYKPADERLAQIVEQRLISTLGTQDDGARKENFYVVRHTTMPAILVETAFLSNASDADRLRQPTFRQNVAQAIGDGISAYSGSPQNSGGSAPSAVGSLVPNSIGDPKPADDLAP